MIAGKISSYEICSKTYHDFGSYQRLMSCALGNTSEKSGNSDSRKIFYSI